MRALVTGVAGQLGHDVVNELLRRGEEVIGSDLAASRDRRAVLHAAVCRRKIRADHLFAATQQFIHDIVAQLARDAGHQGAHQRRSPYIFSKYF